MCFSFDEYFLKTFLLPMFIVTTMAAITALSIIRFIKVYPNRANKNISFMRRVIRFLIPVWLAVAGVALILVNVSVLRYGFYLPFESEKDQVTIIGKVQNIERVTNSPRYSIHGDSSARASIVTVDQTPLYFMSADNIKFGDVIEVHYLPKSTMVLEYKEAELSNDLPAEPIKGKDNQMADYTFIGVWLLAFLLLSIFGKQTYFDKKLEAWILQDEKKLTDRVVKNHISYLIIGMLFLSVVLAIIVPLCLLTRFYIALCVPILFGVICFSWVYLSYRNEKIEYNEKEMIIFNYFGKKTVVNNKDIISVETTYRNKWLTRGKEVRVMQVRYQVHDVVNESMHTESLTLFYTQHIGLTRFFDFYSHRE